MARMRTRREAALRVRQALRSSIVTLLAATLVALPAAAQQPSPAPEPTPAEAPPPRSVADIVKVLEQFKPDPAKADAARALLAQSSPETEDRKALFQHHLRRGMAARALGDDTGAIPDLRKARELAPAGEPAVISLMQALAGSEFRAGNALTALQLMRERLNLIPRDRQGAIMNHEGFASMFYSLLGDFDSARSSLRNAEATFSQLARSPNIRYYRHEWTSGLEMARGNVFLAEGKLPESEAALRKALREMDADLPDFEFRRRSGMDPRPVQSFDITRVNLLRGLSGALARQGRNDEAEIVIRSALKLSLERQGRYTSDTATDLRRFAFILLEQGRFAEGALMARESVRSVEGSGAAPNSYAAVEARRGLGAALVADSKWTEALAIFDAMRDAARADPELAKTVLRGDLDWAQALIKMQRAPEARDMLRNMLATSLRQTGDKDARTVQIRGFYAVSLAKSGAPAEALTEFAKSVPALIEQVRNEAAADSGSVRRVRRLTFIIETYMDLLADTQRAGTAVPGIDPVAESFRLADIARGSDVQRALSASAARSNISDPALAELARREQDAQRRISSLSDILRSLLAAPPAQQLPAVIAQMRKDVEALTQERAAAKRDIERRFPEYAELVDPKPVTVASVQTALRAQETLISIYAGEENTFVWAVPKSGAATLARVPLGAAQLGKTVETLRKALDPQATSIDQIPRFDLALAASLYEDLLKPVESTWKGKSSHLLLVPHAALGQLPLGLLPIARTEPVTNPIPFDEYRKVPWLIREVALTQLPSVTALATLRRAPAARGERRMYLGIGDPYFSKEQAAGALQLAAAPEPAAGPVTRGLPVKLRNAPKTSGVDSAELALLPRLPDTEDEILEIAKSLGADPKLDVILHKEANVKTVTTMNLADRRIVHFATHGLVPGELNGLTQPALALTAPEVAGVDGDGLLTMDKILSLKLNADWVVLSACNTASGDGAGSEAVSGLGRAFFYAGARALLVSNWPVESVASRLLMSDIFRRYANSPAQAKAESLRQAMIGMIDGPGSVDRATGKTAYAYAHPLFWAPFVLVGD